MKFSTSACRQCGSWLSAVLAEGREEPLHLPVYLKELEPSGGHAVIIYAGLVSLLVLGSYLPHQAVRGEGFHHDLEPVHGDADPVGYPRDPPALRVSADDLQDGRVEVYLRPLRPGSQQEDLPLPSVSVSPFAPLFLPLPGVHRGCSCGLRRGRLTSSLLRGEKAAAWRPSLRGA